MNSTQEFEQTEISEEKMTEIKKAVALLEDAAQRHEQTLPDTLSAGEMNDLYEAAALYRECKNDPACGRENLRFALDDFTAQITDRKQKVEKILNIKPKFGQSIAERLESTSAEFQERFGKDLFKDLAELARKFPGGPQMISDEKEKIECYQLAKRLLTEMEHPINPLKPLKPQKKDQPTVAFAKQAIFELQGEVEALLAGRMAKAA